MNGVSGPRREKREDGCHSRLAQPAVSSMPGFPHCWTRRQRRPAVPVASPPAAIVPSASGTLRKLLPAALVLMVLCGGCLRQSDPELLRIFHKAQETFDKATSPDDYLQAAALYQELLDRGVVSGGVLFNQGNAFMRAGQRGRAIAAYRRAQRYRPRESDLEGSLRAALPGDAPAPRRPVVEQILFWQNWLSYPEKFYLMAVAGCATFVASLLASLLRRRQLARAGLAGLVVTLVMAFSAGYDWYRCDYLAHGVTIVKETTARKGNAQSYEPALTATLSEGTEFLLLGRREGWLWVRLPGGQEGWLPERSAVTY